MLKVYTSTPNYVTLESDGQKARIDVSRSEAFAMGMALHHVPDRATSYVADKIVAAMLAMGGAERGADGEQSSGTITGLKSEQMVGSVHQAKRGGR